MKASLAFCLLASSVALAADPPAGKDRSSEKKEQKKGESNGEKGPPTRSEVCHKTDEGTQITLRLPAPAVKAHLDHGDSEGACASGDTAGSRAE